MIFLKKVKMEIIKKFFKEEIFLHFFIKGSQPCRIYLVMEKDMNTIIDRLINEEANRASDSSTRGTVKMRVFLKIARLMGISLQTIYDTQHLVRIDPSISKAIEILWNGESPIEMDSLNQNWITVWCHDVQKSSSPEDDELFQKFLAKDFAKPADVSKILSALEKRFVESNHFRRELGYVFAADGMLDDGPNCCFERYSEHLAIPKTLGEPIDDDNPKEDPMEAHVRAVRTIYRDVKYATPERIGATLKRLLNVESGDHHHPPPKKRGDNRSSASSESSSSSSSDDDSVSSSIEDDWLDNYDKYIADQYKKLVGKKINLIIHWMKERLRRHREEEAENIRKRAIASKRKRVSFESKTVIKDMSKKLSQPDSETSEAPTEPEEMISSAAATVSDSKPKTIMKKIKKKTETDEVNRPKKAVKSKQSKKIKKSTVIADEESQTNNEETDTVSDATKHKMSEKNPTAGESNNEVQSEGTKRKKSEKIKQSKKAKPDEEAEDKKVSEFPAELVQSDKESDDETSSSSKNDHE